MRDEILKRIENVREEALREVASVNDVGAAEKWRVKYLGRKGVVPDLLTLMGSLSSEERPHVGRSINDLKTSLSSEIDRRIEAFSMKKEQAEISRERIDITLPGRVVAPGHRHPIRQAMDYVVDIFTGMGFSVFEGPEIESDYYNFEALNVPPDHPARDMQDTFYVAGDLLLRTHTSPVQIHVMEKSKPPVFMIAPGAVYRRDSDVSHSPMFHQVEGLMVDEHITFRDLKGVLTVFCRKVFGEKHGVRFRPSFFPFTEPSAEVDISCVMCGGSGCRVCKNTGWMEILGCGMVDPQVFTAVKYDPKKVTGFAFGVGIDRVAMLLYGINDIRLFYENDLRFLEQF
jgi:phenylalanyl-tRNA synthetase alpha chain